MPDHTSTLPLTAYATQRIWYALILKFPLLYSAGYGWLRIVCSASLKSMLQALHTGYHIQCTYLAPSDATRYATELQHARFAIYSLILWHIVCLGAPAGN